MAANKYVDLAKIAVASSVKQLRPHAQLSYSKSSPLLPPIVNQPFPQRTRALPCRPAEWTFSFSRLSLFGAYVGFVHHLLTRLTNTFLTADFDSSWSSHSSHRLLHQFGHGVLLQTFSILSFLRHDPHTLIYLRWWPRFTLIRHWRKGRGARCTFFSPLRGCGRFVASHSPSTFIFLVDILAKFSFWPQ